MAGTVLTAAQLNTDIRDNLNYLRSNAVNFIATTETTTSTTYADLATVGPAVTVTTDTQAVVLLYCGLNNGTGATLSIMSFAVSGATTVAASDAFAASWNGTAGQTYSSSAAFLVTGLTIGSNTFTCKYRVGGGTGTFQNRRITVMPS